MNRRAPHRDLPAQIVLGLLILRAGLVPAAGAPAPFTNEDVVRLVMTGTAENVILQAIEERPADFDLDPGVVEELRRAGVPERVLEAMRRRQAAMPRPEPVEPSSPAVEARGFLQVVLGADTDDDAAIAIIGLPRRSRAAGSSLRPSRHARGQHQGVEDQPQGPERLAAPLWREAEQDDLPLPVRYPHRGRLAL